MQHNAIQKTSKQPLINLSGTRIPYADLSNGQVHTSLDSADISKVIGLGADFSLSSFRGAKMTGVRFNRANMLGTKFSAATELSEDSQFDFALFLCATVDEMPLTRHWLESKNVNVENIITDENDLKALLNKLSQKDMVIMMDYINEFYGLINSVRIRINNNMEMQKDWWSLTCYINPYNFSMLQNCYLLLQDALFKRAEHESYIDDFGMFMQMIKMNRAPNHVRFNHSYYSNKPMELSKVEDILRTSTLPEGLNVHTSNLAPELITLMLILQSEGRLINPNFEMDCGNLDTCQTVFDFVNQRNYSGSMTLTLNHLDFVTANKLIPILNTPNQSYGLNIVVASIDDQSFVEQPDMKIQLLKLITDKAKQDLARRCVVTLQCLSTIHRAKGMPNDLKKLILTHLLATNFTSVVNRAQFIGNAFLHCPARFISAPVVKATKRNQKPKKDEYLGFKRGFLK